MLTRSQLAELYRTLANTRVLSVYIDGAASDPATQRSWRLQLDHGLTDLRRWLEGSPRAEREEFEQCVRRLDAAIAAFSGGIGAPGWAAFITSDRVHDAQPLPVPAPTLAVWSTGPCVAPYMRALKERRPVVVVRADARHASLYRYQFGELERVEVVRAYSNVSHPEHMGAPARQGYHTGTRGTAGRDAAQRTLLRGRDRMIADAVDKANALAGADGWILVGGIKRVASRLVQLLTPLAHERVAALDALDVHASDADIAEIARAGASTLRDTLDDGRVAEIVDLAGAHGLGAVGPSDAREALEQTSVHDLYLTNQYIEDHAAEAEAAIRAALDQDASVEEVSGLAAERLNQYGGMAAGLRFRASPVEHAGGGRD